MGLARIAVATTLPVATLMLTGGANATELCGRTFASSIVDEIRQELAVAGVPVIRDEQDRLVLEDRAGRTVWTFVKAGHPAAPAVICRRSQPSGIHLDIETQGMCSSPQAACDALLESLAR